MGGEQAATVMSIVAEGAAKAAGKEPDREALAKQEAHLTKLFNDQSGGFYTSGHDLDDGMIDPRETRQTLGFLLATCWEGRHREVRRNSFGIARM
jgi:geranyl-CoA carboxylase beta subunit